MRGAAYLRAGVCAAACMCARWGRRRRRRRWSHLSMVIKAGAVVTKLSPHARLLSAASILTEQQTHYRETREGKGVERLRERERQREIEMRGVSRPVAEGLI